MSHPLCQAVRLRAAYKLELACKNGESSSICILSCICICICMRASYQTWACTQEWRLKQQRPTGAKTLACLIIPYCALYVTYYHSILNGTTPLMLWQHVQTKFHWTTMCAIVPPVKLLLRFISNFFSIVWLSECNVHRSIWNIFNSASNPCILQILFCLAVWMFNLKCFQFCLIFNFFLIL